jgi:prevent-host-death family protein
MSEVTVRELRNHGGEVIDRAARGERVTITRAGKPVAELRSLPAPAVSAETLIERRRHLPRLDPAALRRDLDALIDAGL